MAQERIWYAVLQSNEDDDWGHGSRDLEEAKEMAREYREDGYPDAHIAVIDDVINPVCLEEIREF